MTTNVGRVDALSRWIVGSLALLGGLVSLAGFYRELTLLTWAVLALLFVTGLFFLVPGLSGGTAFSGLAMMVVAVVEGWLAATSHGEIALVVGAIVCAFEFTTALVKWGPLNALTHLDTRQADHAWALRS